MSYRRFHDQLEAELGFGPRLSILETTKLSATL